MENMLIMDIQQIKALPDGKWLYAPPTPTR